MRPRYVITDGWVYWIAADAWTADIHAAPHFRFMSSAIFAAEQAGLTNYKVVPIPADAVRQAS